MDPDKPYYWSGSPPSRCDLCERPFGNLMFDVYVKHFHTWGNLCVECSAAHQCEVGTGKGQCYELQADGRWMKTGG